MKFHLKTTYIFYFILLCNCISYGQIKEESVRASRKYEPNVKNIEKKKNTPTIEPTKQEKEPQQYDLKDIPAVPSFNTTELPPQEIKDSPSIKTYNNYLKAGYGNFSNLLLEGFASYPLNTTTDVGLSFNHLSTKGIKDESYAWNTKQSNTHVEAFYKQQEDSGKYTASLGYKNQGVNYYGLSNLSLGNEDMDIKQKYNHLFFNGDIQLFENNYFDKATLGAGYFWDTYKAKEYNGHTTINLSKDGFNASSIIQNLTWGIEAKALVDYTKTSFELYEANKYSYFTFQLEPVLKLVLNQSILKIGANAAYNLESQNNDSQFYFYPKAELNVVATSDLALNFGIEGGLKQNTYQNLSTENPYLLSNQILLPTNTTYKVYGGIKGRIGKNFKIMATGSYAKKENIHFFVKNLLTDTSTDLLPYNRINTFSSTYDNGNELAINGNVEYIAIPNLSLELDLNFINYSLQNLPKAYYVPTFSGALNTQYRFFKDKLILKSNLMFTGERDSNDFIYNPSTGDYAEKNTVLDSFIDINLGASYQIIQSLEVFVNINNLLGKDYQRYLHYPVQTTQFMGGLLFRF